MTRRNSESGVILIMVAITLSVLTAMAAFGVDWGQAWYARSQAQAAADSGALAGAVALATDDTTWPFANGGVVDQAAIAAAQRNLILGAAGSVTNDDVQPECPDFPPYDTAPNNTHCVRVDVYRDTAHGNAFSTLFAQLFGVSTDGVRATATAKVSAANASHCVRPYYIPDRFTDTNGNGKADPGEYTSDGGYIVPRDIGLTVTFHSEEGPGAYGQLEVGGNGVPAITFALLHCAPNGVETVVDQPIGTTPGDKMGQKHGLDQLINVVDPGAHYDAATNTIQGSCAETLSCNCGDGLPCPYNGTQSPRIIQAPLCDPTVCLGVKNGNITPLGILSFFITGYTIKANELDINAVLIGSSGDLSSGGGMPAPEKGFAWFVSLIR